MHQLTKLNYAYDALEPYLDAKTMEIHHSKHHQTYVDKLNKALENYPTLQEFTVAELLTKIDTNTIDPQDKQAIINHGGGVANHNFFWQIMDPANKPDEQLQQEITTTFGSIDLFKEKFSQTALNHFGSGWAWLVRDQNNQLQIYSTTNQNSPLSLGHQPLLTIDVWEHAYYLKFQNKRADYINNWWSVIKLI
ncbi:MAG: superoxide dismutase [Candidatus Komeilibacteria bacterium CG_4_10_14_0_2_um_filter_37_10]|uniref:Superoxide dismutase n=1 Tax=Candidatus Komeilibacteria bacterium CG_4_10_14_0_2_um_filter_37_10 TaxID=1974470 RepID=A0A2M7VFS5_9BACT|nr:MAG: superoxide dismutase [Candidatus Komeilibacteria bacterium CG_4_10_14_0_2_um_filter_37_10]PJA92640.1 MAG: superoxide dismutase [Candidatus Komeilibacteria bacterium CG_4_9_14_3_um_filter_37_5]